MKAENLSYLVKLLLDAIIESIKRENVLADYTLGTVTFFSKAPRASVHSGPDRPCYRHCRGAFDRMVQELSGSQNPPTSGIIQPGRLAPADAWIVGGGPLQGEPASSCLGALGRRSGDTITGNIVSLLLP